MADEFDQKFKYPEQVASGTVGGMEAFKAGGEGYNDALDSIFY